jgi:hypothetical protein
MPTPAPFAGPSFPTVMKPVASVPNLTQYTETDTGLAWTFSASMNAWFMNAPSVVIQGFSGYTKPTTNIPTGATYTEQDTGNVFVFDAAAQRWNQAPGVALGNSSSNALGVSTTPDTELVTAVLLGDQDTARLILGKTEGDALSDSSSFLL